MNLSAVFNKLADIIAPTRISPEPEGPTLHPALVDLNDAYWRLKGIGYDEAHIIQFFSFLILDGKIRSNSPWFDHNKPKEQQ